jgi:hypothetical protein
MKNDATCEEFRVVIQGVIMSPVDTTGSKNKEHRIPVQ